MIFLIEITNISNLITRITQCLYAINTLGFLKGINIYHTKLQKSIMLMEIKLLDIAAMYMKKCTSAAYCESSLISEHT